VSKNKPRKNPALQLVENRTWFLLRRLLLLIIIIIGLFFDHEDEDDTFLWHSVEFQWTIQRLKSPCGYGEFSSIQFSHRNVSPSTDYTTTELSITTGVGISWDLKYNIWPHKLNQKQ
jgi:hypothetical protein